MKTTSLLLASLVTAVSVSSLSAQTLFSDNFDSGLSGANWTINASTGTHPVNFAFDYSGVGIPSAPNSGGSTVGLKLQANTAGSNFGGVSVSPTGGSFTGDYRLRFDLWANFNGDATVGLGTGGTNPSGGNGSTQMSTAGLLTSGTVAQHGNGTHSSIWVGVTGDGGAGTTTGDYRVYSSVRGVGNNGIVTNTSGVYAAGTAANSRDDINAYYQGFGEQTAPAAQVGLYPDQDGTTRAGAIGFAWHDVIITFTNGIINWSIDGLSIATISTNGATLSGNNFFLGSSDINATSSTDVNAINTLFTLVDNVRLEVVPEPSTYALIGLSIASVAYFRRRR